VLLLGGKWACATAREERGKELLRDRGKQIPGHSPASKRGKNTEKRFRRMEEKGVSRYQGGGLGGV